MATMRGWRTTGDGRLSIGEIAVPEPASSEVLSWNRRGLYLR
jgi:propanol-preferring alcohol dehydrogenase